MHPLYRKHYFLAWNSLMTDVRRTADDSIAAPHKQRAQRRTEMRPRLMGPHVTPAPKPALDVTARKTCRISGRRPLRARPSRASWAQVAVFVVGVVLAFGAPTRAGAEDSGSSRRTPSLAAGSSTQRQQQTADSRARAAPIATAPSRRRSESAYGRSSGHSGSRGRSRRQAAWARGDQTGRGERSEIDRSAPRKSSGRGHGEGDGEDADYSESSEDEEDSYENYDTEDGTGSAEQASCHEDDDEDLHVHATTSGVDWSSSPGDSSEYRSSGPGGSSEYNSSGSEEEEESRSEDDSLSDEGRRRGRAVTSNPSRASQLADSSPHLAQPDQDNGNNTDNDNDNAVEVCIVTWNLAEATPSKKDLDFLRRAAAGSGLVAVGVQEIENLKPRRNEGGRTREWRRLLIQ